MCRAKELRQYLQGQGHTLRSKMAINELVRAITMSFIKGFWNHLAHLFTIIRRCVARKNYFNISKVKVTLRGHVPLVRAITMSSIKGFWNHLAHMFTIIGRCVARNNYTPSTIGNWGYIGVTLSVGLSVCPENSCPGHNYVVHCEILKSFGTFVHHH